MIPPPPINEILDIFNIWATHVHLVLSIWIMGVFERRPFEQNIFCTDLGVSILVQTDLDMDCPWTVRSFDIPTDAITDIKHTHKKT